MYCYVLFFLTGDPSRAVRVSCVRSLPLPPPARGYGGGSVDTVAGCAVIVLLFTLRLVSVTTHVVLRLGTLQPRLLSLSFRVSVFLLSHILSTTC